MSDTAARLVKPVVLPSPLMLLVATMDGNLKPEFEEWEDQVGPLQPESLVP